AETLDPSGFGVPQKRGQGSGFIIDREGHILTNNHVVHNVSSVKVTLHDGTSLDAQVVGTDRENDLALLKIDPDTPDNITPLPLGDSDNTKPGQMAIALGTPFGLEGSITVGVISGVGRSIKSIAQRPIIDILQTDAAINPGNSGGPLVNIEGEVIGINTMIYTKSGGSLGIGFAVPINLAKNVVQQLISKGHFDRGYLGIFLGKIDKNLRKALKLSDGEGALVNSVIEGSPAEKAGLKEGDVILKINGKKIKSFTHLMQIVAGFPVNKVVRILVLRNGTKKVNIKLKIGKRPGEEKLSKKKKTTETWLGLKIVSVSDLSERERRRYRIRRNEKGVVVHKLTSDEYEGGLQAGDLIKAINYIPIYGIKSYRKFIKRYRDRKSFIFKIKRGGRTMFIAINS
ncbi:MAG: trypsin-like peptidase domain-containing protein, partial [Spirochaetes bacterium]|nr:trypsin-like peptidase domain-containing protein [Spirochaetota bacterium]